MAEPELPEIGTWEDIVYSARPRCAVMDLVLLVDPGMGDRLAPEGRFRGSGSVPRVSVSQAEADDH